MSIWIVVLIISTVPVLGNVTEENTSSIPWARTYGNGEDNGLIAVAITPNGDIIAVGYTDNNLGSKSDAWVLRLDRAGNIKWHNSYGGPYWDGANTVAVADNGDIIVAGHYGATDEDGSNSNAWIFRLDENGNVKWQGIYSGENWDGISAIAIAPNGDIIAVGTTESFGAGSSDVWVLRLDKEGNVKWQRTYGGISEDWANSVAIAPNGDVIVVGGTKSFGSGEGDIWVLRLDGSGNVKWQRTYGGVHHDGANSVAIADNGDIIVAGYYWATYRDGANGDAWVLRLDGEGNVKWQKTYGGRSSDVVSGIFLASSEDIIAVGYTDSFSSGNLDVWVFDLDGRGNVKWQRTYGGSRWDWAKGVAIAPNGDIIVIGGTNSFGAGKSDAWVLRIPLNGKLPGCGFCHSLNLPGKELHLSVMETDAHVEDSSAIVRTEEIEVQTQYFNLSYSANSSSYWARSYGGNKSERANAIAMTPNGDFVVVGYYGVIDAWSTNADAWILRLEENGSIRWQKIYGGSNDPLPPDELCAVAIASNRDIVVVGYTWSFGAGMGDFWVLRLDENGNVIWQKTYGGSGDDRASAVAIADNGDIIVAGYTYSFGAGERDVWILRLDKEGNVKWQKTYGGQKYDEAHALAIAPNGDIIVAGYTDNSEAGGRDALILRLDENGSVEWQGTYGGENVDVAKAIALASNGDIIVAGYTESFDVKDCDAWVLRLDGQGNVKWQKAYGDYERRIGNYDQANSVAIAPNGDIIIAGYSKSIDQWGLNGDVWVLRLDKNGSVIWQRTYGGKLGDVVNGLTLSEKGDILMAGHTFSFGAGGRDVWVIRLPSDGELPNCTFCGSAKIQVLDPFPSVHESNATVGKGNARVQNSDVRTFKIEVQTQYEYASITINSNPPGASVYVNDTYLGTTPLVTTLVPGLYNVKISKRDYVEYTTKRILNPGDHQELNVSLTPDFGYLTISSHPSGAVVIIDGNEVGNTPLEGYRLPVGQYKVVIQKEGYEAEDFVVTIRAGLEVTRSINLTSVQTTETPTPITTTTTTITTTEGSSTTAGTDKGMIICGPATVLVLTTIPLLMRKRR